MEKRIRRVMVETLESFTINPQLKTPLRFGVSLIATSILCGLYGRLGGLGMLPFILITLKEVKE